MTKAAYVRAMYGTSWPSLEFPLDAEVLAEIPDDLPGDVPRSLTDLLRADESGADDEPTRPRGLFAPTQQQKPQLGTHTPQAPYRLTPRRRQEPPKEYK